ncbi:MAG: polysulfide reductase NrfD [Chloroflexi bacterium]|nr:polysulfide reductase NrfD [Chloroflexota bacterium]
MKPAYYLIMVALSLMGLWALGVRLAEGLKVTALTSYIAWGFWVSAYIYFIGLSAGSFLLSTLIYVFGMREMEKVGRMALLTALFSLGAGLLFIWVDLGHWERFWEIFARPNWTSVMTIESWLYLIYMGLILAELWFLMRDDLALGSGAVGWRGRLYRVLALGYEPSADPVTRRQQQERAHRWIMALGILGVPTAIGVHGGTGSIFAVAIARPYWNSSLFPIVFLVSALASGAGLVAFLYAAFGPRDAEFQQVLKRVASLTVLFIGLDLLLVTSEILVGLYGGVPVHQDVFTAISVGPYSFVFWLGQLGLAGVVPMVMVAVALARRPMVPTVVRAAGPRPVGRWEAAAVAVAAAVRAAGRRPVGGLEAAAVAVAAVVLAGDIWAVVPGRAPAVMTVSQVGGPILPTIAFWAAQLALLACLAGVAVTRWGNPHFWLGAAGLSTVAGILAVRLNIVIPGLILPVLERLDQAYQDPRLVYSYFPSGLEWLSTVGLIALVVLVFSLAYEVLPIYGRQGATP